MTAVAWRARPPIPGVCRVAVALGSALLVAGCDLATSPNPYEAWSADLTQTQQVFFMGIRREGATITGNAELSHLLSSGPGEALTVTGTRTADTLDLTFLRPLGGTYRFRGWYAQRGTFLVGTIDGGAFTQQAIGFRRR